MTLCLESSPKPILIFAYGNLSRGDDALGPLLLQYIVQHCDSSEIEFLTDFQLQVEHALDIDKRDLVLFVDASVSSGNAFVFTELKPVKDKSYSTHAMSPSAVLAVYQNINKQNPPPCFLLAIKGEQFELGEGLSEQAQQHLEQACQFVQQLLACSDSLIWRQYALLFE